jgi:AraC family transcriptional regulator
MGTAIPLQSAEAMRSAFRVEPEIAEISSACAGLGVYGWSTPPMEGFELPRSDELVLALHIGGSRRVRAVTDRGLSRSLSVPGRVTLLPPDRTAAFRTEGSISLMSLHVPCTMLESLPSTHLRTLTQPNAARFAFRDPFVSAGMEALLRAARSGRSVQPEYFSRVADALLGHLALWTMAAADGRADVPASRGATLGRLRLEQLLAYMESRISQKLSIDELADQTGLSRSGFTHEFRTAVGMSAHQYLSTKRIAAAKQMLGETDLDLAFIAQETGFCSQSHFSAVFRHLVGCTPAQFRHRH